MPNKEDEQVLGAVQVALGTDAYQGKLILANFHLLKQAVPHHEQYMISVHIVRSYLQLKIHVLVHLLATFRGKVIQ